MVVRDEDGEYLFNATASICPFDLRIMLRYAQQERIKGINQGRKELAAELRGLLGAAGEQK